MKFLAGLWRPTAASVVCLSVFTAFAGPLNPPVGPVVPTAKPLAAVEPRIAPSDLSTPGDSDSVFRIVQPGSYYLTGNLAAGAGIRVIATDARVLRNACNANERGIEISGAGNLILSNSCSGNGVNFEIVAGNIYGPIVNRTTGTFAATSGSSATGTTNNSDPNANFAY